MERLGARTTRSLAKKLKVKPGQVSIINDWLKQTPTVTAKTRTLKRILRLLAIPLEELERAKAILDRDFPVDLDSPQLSKLYTHALNEGHIKRAKDPTAATLRYVNQDPALIKTFIDTVKALGGWAKILKPGKPGFDAYTDTLTARLLVAAGLPPGRKTLTDPPLHPAVPQDKNLAKQHLKTTFLEEGYATFSYAKNRLQLIIGINRSKDITHHIPSQTLQQLLQHKGQKIQPTQYFSKKFIDNHLLPLAPLALKQEKKIIEALIKEEYSLPLLTKIRISYLHVSKKGRVTANYRLAMRSREAIQLFKDIVLAQPIGTWKEHRLQQMLQTYHEFRGRQLTPEERQEVKARTPPSHIPEDWLISKAQQLLSREAEWIKDTNQLKIITRWYKKNNN